MEVSKTRGTWRINANYKGKNKDEQNKIYSSDFKLCLGRRKIKRELYQTIFNKPVV